MSLFERIQKKIIIESSSDTTGQNKKNKKKEFSSNISRTVKVSKDTEGLGNRQSRLDATDPKQGGYPRVDDAIDAETPSGKTKLTDTTKGSRVKTYKLNNTDTKKKTRTPQKSFFDPKKAKADREKLIAKRKEYGIDRKGNISDAGVERYARKTKQLSSGSNLPVTPTQKELDLAKKRAVGGTPIKNKAGKVIGTTTGKYGGNLPRKRPSNAPSLAQIKAKIDAKNPTYTSPITGGKLPLKDPDLKRMSSADRKIYQKIKDTTPSGGMPKGTVLPDGTIKPKLPRKVYVKTPKSVAFPQGLKPVDTKTKEGEKLARKITKKFVTDKELLTGEKPKPYKPPVNNKSKNLFSRIKGFAKKFHQKMTQDAGFRRTSGSGRLMKDTLGGIARDVNKTRHIYKNTIRGNTFRLLNKVLPGHYKTLAAAGLIAYGLSNRGKNKDDGKGKNIPTPSNPYAGKNFKTVTGTLKLGNTKKK